MASFLLLHGGHVHHRLAKFCLPRIQIQRRFRFVQAEIHSQGMHYLVLQIFEDELATLYLSSIYNQLEKLEALLT